MHHTNTPATQRFVSLIVITLLCSCGGGGGGGGTTTTPPLPPAPPPVSFSTPVAIDAAKAEDVLLVGMGNAESMMQLGNLVTSKLIELANQDELSINQSCSGGSRTLAIVDADNSGDMTTGDSVQIQYSGTCFESEVNDPVGGAITVQLTDVFIGNLQESLWRGSYTFQGFFVAIGIPDSSEVLNTTVAGNVEFSFVTGRSSRANLLLSLAPGSSLTITVGTNGTSPLQERLLNFDLRRAHYYQSSGGLVYDLDFSYALESAILEGRIDCSTSSTLTADDFEVPASGRVNCNGASSSAVALVPDLLNSGERFIFELDADGDNTFEPLSIPSFTDWDDIVEGALFDDNLERLDEVASTIDEATLTGVTRAVSITDIVYSPVTNKIYVSNAAGILELNPNTLEVERSVSISGEATMLAVSDDGSTLWFGLRDENQVGQLTTADMALGANLSLGLDQIDPNDTRSARWIAIVPGTTNQLAIVTRDGEVIAYNNGVELPEQINVFGLDLLEFRDATSLVGVEDGNSGYDTYAISYDPSSGLTIQTLYPRLSSGSRSSLTLGNEHFVNSRGSVFDERTGKLVGELNTSGPGFDATTVDVEQRRIYALDEFSSQILAYDEDTLTKVAQHNVDFVILDVLGFLSFKEYLIAANDTLIVAGQEGLGSIAKSQLVANVDAGPCRTVDLSDTLSAGTYQKFSCPVTGMAYDSTRDLIYVSIDADAGPMIGNSIAVLDGQTLEVVQTISVFGSPINLEISKDGTLLNATLDDSNQIVQINLDTQLLSRIVNLGYTQSVFNGVVNFGELQIGRIVIDSPTGAGDVIVNSNEREVFIFRDGQSLGEYGNEFNDYSDLFYGEADPTTLIGIDINGNDISVYTANELGVTFVQSLADVVDARDSVQSGNSIYTSGGDLFDLTTLSSSQVCFTDDRVASNVAITQDGSTLYYALNDATIFRCDLQTDQLSESFLIPPFGVLYGGFNGDMAVRGDNELLYTGGNQLIKIAVPQ